LTLLTGLDLPWVADGLQRDGPHVREPVDALIRGSLARAQLPYHVVYGQGTERLARAVDAVDFVARGTPPGRAGGIYSPPERLSAWSCEKCGDAACEHRLFSLLPGSRQPL
jgi:hypothetical protein